MAGQQKEKRSYESVVAQLRANDPEYAKEPAHETSQKTQIIADDAETYISLHKQGISVSYKGAVDDLRHAAADGELGLVRYLCESDQFYRNVPNTLAASARTAAIAAGQLDIIKYFDENAIVRSGEPIMHYDRHPAVQAAQNGHIHVLKYLRKRTDDFSRRIDEYIEAAVKTNRVGVLNYLKSTGADIKQICRMTLHRPGIAMTSTDATADRTATLRFLFDNSAFEKPPEADAQKPFPYGDFETLAGVAGAWGDIELLQILHQEYNVDLNRFSEHFLKGHTSWGQDAVLAYMTGNGIKLTEENTLATLHSAAHNYNANAIRHILQHTKHSDETLSSLAQDAISQHKYKILQVLEENNVPLNAMPDATSWYYAQWKLWQQVQHMDAPRRLADRSPHYFRLKPYLAVLEMLEEESGAPRKHSSMMDNPAAIAASFLVDREEAIYAYNATGLFKTADRVLAYLEKWGTNTKQPLHDVIHMIQLPNKGHMNVAAWGDAVMRHGPKMARLVQFAHVIPEPAKDGRGQWSYTKTEELTAQFLYEQAVEAQDLARYCHGLRWTEQAFDDALQIVQQYKTDYADSALQKPRYQIPIIEIDGDIFDKPGYQFYKLPDGDVRGLLLGEFTDCCQHVNGQGKSCAKHGFLSPHGGFYVIADIKTDTIVAQSWAWRGKKGELTLDSLETLQGHMNKTQWEKLLDVFTAAAHGQKKCEITAVCIGKGGDTAKLSYPTQEPPALPVDREPYADSSKQYRVPYSETRLALPRPV